VMGRARFLVYERGIWYDVLESGVCVDGAVDGRAMPEVFWVSGMLMSSWLCLMCTTEYASGFIQQQPSQLTTLCRGAEGRGSSWNRRCEIDCWVGMSYNETGSTIFRGR